MGNCKGNKNNGSSKDGGIVGGGCGAGSGSSGEG